MSNLIKPAEYAKKLGISRQAVYAKIKKGILEAKNIEGKLYVVEGDTHNLATHPTTTPKPKSTTPAQNATASKDYRELLAAKDETIGVLKETISDLKETNKMITTTLRGEVELLKEAFSEMRTIYSRQIEHLQDNSDISIEEDSSDEAYTEDLSSEYAISDGANVPEIEVEVDNHTGLSGGDDLVWIEVSDLFDEMSISKKKQQESLVKKLKKLFKKGDSRVDLYDGELIVLADASFEDLITTKEKKATKKTKKKPKK